MHRRPDTPELVELHRFTHDWERHATLALRSGDTEAIFSYARHNRIREGNTDEMLDIAYQAWRADIAAGKASILVTESAHAMRALNERARAERVLHDGTIDGGEVQLADDTRASVGDVVITRRNDRTLTTNRSANSWVNNGDRWRITGIRGDGSVSVERVDPRRRESTLLPAGYVAEHLDLGYAITAHRAQGVTVDTAHVVVTATTTRENLYVSMTRGRDANIAYVALDQPDDSHATPEPDDVSGRTVLDGVLHHSGASLSAHQTIEAEHEIHAGIGRFAAELETIAADAQRERFTDLLARSGLTEQQRAAVTGSSAFGPLAAAFRRAEAYRHDLETLVPRVVAQHRLDDADDIAAVLRHRIAKHTMTPPRGCRLRPRLIAGLIPEPLGPMSAEDRLAIDERKNMIEARAAALAEDATDRGAAWVRRLGEAPSDSVRLSQWRSDVAVVAAYRDRYEVTSDLPAGSRTPNATQEEERQRALVAVRRAGTIEAQQNRHPIDPLGPARPLVSR